MPSLIAAILLGVGLAAVGAAPPAAAHTVRPAERSVEAARTVAGEAVLAPTAEALPGDELRITSGAASVAPQVTGSPLPTAGALLALIALFAAIASRRRAVAVVLSLVLLVLAFESAVHSVHHLGSTEESKCVVASAATHVQGTVGAPVIALDEPVSIGDACAVETAPLAALPWRAWRGRAPPSIPTS